MKDEMKLAIASEAASLLRRCASGGNGNGRPSEERSAGPGETATSTRSLHASTAIRTLKAIVAISFSTHLLSASCIWTGKCIAISFRTLLTGLVVMVLTSCGGGGGGNASCSSTPYINSSSIPSATVGIQYASPFDASYACGSIFICDGVDLTQAPPGAGVDSIRNLVFWTPTISQANTNVRFEIATQPDDCGERATQSWSVTVFPQPVIQSFTATPTAVAPGQPVTLTAVFQGTGHIEGIGPVSSGVPITTAALTIDISFTLVVTNNGGGQAQSVVRVHVLGPPIIQSFVASPSAMGLGSSSTLSWLTSGDFSRAVISPSGIDVMGASALVVKPTETTTYVLQLSTAFGESASASVQVEVVAPALIQSFTATPSSVGPGGVVTLSATFQGTGTVERETGVNGFYAALGTINSGGTLDSGAILRNTRFRLVVLNALGVVTTRDLVVTVSGPGSFKPAIGLPTHRLFSSATRLFDGRAFMAGFNAGGLDGSGSIEIFDPVSETFSAGPNLLRQGILTTLLPDGRVFITGGTNADIYDPTTETIYPAGQVSGSVLAGTPLPLLDGRVVIRAWAGGDPRGSGVVIYVLATGTFGAFMRFICPSCDVNAEALLPDRAGLFIRPSGLSEVFSPVTDSFSITGGVNYNHCVDFSVASLPDGRVMVIGGCTLPAPPEIYDPSTGLFNVLGQGLARNYGSAVVLANGKVLLAGGTLYDPHPWAELYDPAANAFTATGGLRTSRVFPTATLLRDGRVLIVGGCTSNQAPCEAEIYTPP